MKTYRVTVEGQTYDVVVEEVPAGAARSDPPAPRATAAPPVTDLQERKEHRVVAPMPGKVVALKVRRGDRVASGTALLVLDAMKMENDLLSSADGTVKSVAATVGASVNTGDLLMVIE
jgi:biotin carboxyl carrier protein